MSLSSRITDLATAIGLAVKGKQNNLISGTNIKTLNSESLLGAGNIVIAGSTNLSITNRLTTTLTVASDTGTDAVIPEASITEAGLLISADKVKINNLPTVTVSAAIPSGTANNGSIWIQT